VTGLKRHATSRNDYELSIEKDNNIEKGGFDVFSGKYFNIGVYQQCLPLNVSCRIPR